MKEEFKQRIVEDNTIAFQDLYSFFASSFHIEGTEGLIILEHAGSNEDFFACEKEKDLASLCNSYLINRRGLSNVVNNNNIFMTFDLDGADFDIKEVMFGYKDCLDLIDYWLSTDRSVLILSEREFKDKRNVSNGAITSTEGGVLETLKATIVKYESMQSECKNELEKKILDSTIQELKARVAEFERTGGEEIDHSLRAFNSEKSIKALKEIYYFYAKQHVRYGIHATFDSIKREQQILNLGEFAFIVKDFELLKNKNDKIKIAEVFKKSSANNQELGFTDFKV